MTPTTSRTANPLLDFTDLPRFGEFKVDQIDGALDHLLAKAKTALATATDTSTEPSWDNVVVPLERAVEQLGRA